MSHTIIVVMSEKDNKSGEIELARQKAEELLVKVSNIVNSPRNGYQSFFIPSDGCNGEEPVNREYFEQRRDDFIEFLETTNLKYLEIQDPPKIKRHK